MKIIKILNLNFIYIFVVIFFFYFPGIFIFLGNEYAKFKIEYNNINFLYSIIGVMLFFIFSLISFKKKVLIRFKDKFDDKQNKLIFIATTLFFIGLIIKLIFSWDSDNLLKNLKNIASFNIFMLLAINLIFFYSCNAYQKKLYKKSICSFSFFIIFFFISFLSSSRTSTLIIILPALFILLHLKILTLNKFLLVFIILFPTIFLIKSFIKQVDRYYIVDYILEDKSQQIILEKESDVKKLYSDLLKLNSFDEKSFYYKLKIDRYFWRNEFLFVILDRINSYHIYDKIIKFNLNYNGHTLREIPYYVIPDQIYSLLKINKKDHIIHIDGIKFGREIGVVDSTTIDSGAGPTLFGELYLNYKILGIIIGVPLVAIFFSLSSNLFTNYYMSPLTIPFYSTFVFYQLSNTMNFLGAHIYIFLCFFSIYIISILIFKYININDLKFHKKFFRF